MSRGVLTDPGHGGRDSGAVSGDGNTLEKDIVLKVGHRVNELLVEYFKAAMTRTDDTFVSLPERVRIANTLNMDLLSIHCNAGGGHGIEVFTSPGLTQSDPWATAVLDELGKEFPGRRIRKDLRDGDPDKEARFAVLTKTRNLAILVELGFIDTEEGERFLRGPKNQERMAQAIFRGTLKARGCSC